MTLHAHDSGSYLLMIRLEKKCDIAVGALGNISFQAGYYIYVGSALRGLRTRIARHLRREKKLHWHIDYFLQRATVEDVLCSHAATEIDLGKTLLASQDFKVINLFGASDSPLPGHLFYCPAANSLIKMRELLPRKLLAVTDEYPSDLA